MKHERDNSVLRVKGLWLEPGQRLPAARQERLEAELERQRRFTGAERITFARGRSEEHTSELQSLMRISYAVFCLKKKQNTIHYYEPRLPVSHSKKTHFEHA